LKQFICIHSAKVLFNFLYLSPQVTNGYSKGQSLTGKLELKMNTEARVEPMSLSRYRIPILESLLLVVAMFWGSSYGMTKAALGYTSVLMFIALRFSITFICLLPILVKDGVLGLNRDWRSALPGGAILAAIFCCEVFGVLHTSAAKAAFIISLSVILTALFEPLINKQRVRPRLAIMAVVSVVGVLCLTSSSSLWDSFRFNMGDGFILIAALLRALMVTSTKRFTQDKTITTTALTAIQSAVVALVAMIALTVSPLEWVFPMQLEFWLIMGYLVLCCTLFSFYVQNYAVRRLSPTRVSLLMGSEPLFGALFAIAWLNESLSMLQLFGGALIFVSVLVTSLQVSK
jgi:drug/metabolite transporter (DMT)-like permease